MRPWATSIAVVVISICLGPAARAEVQGSPDVLVLGDSQLSFGAGMAFVDLFADLQGECGLAPDTDVGVIGVRSTSLRSWTATSRAALGAMCDVDPNWNVNAGVYGSLALTDNPWVQIGRGAQFQFCTAERSPLQAVFHDGYYQPDLLIMFMMGNAAERWAGSAADALQDVRDFVADVPPGQPCIFMTSAPTYREASVQMRLRAQENLAQAFAQVGAQCSFVPGFTTATIGLNLGNAANFRRNGAGQVRDPYHPTEAAARQFLDLQRDALCMAMTQQLGRRAALAGFDHDHEAATGVTLQ
jgi:hypothetical protein